MLCTPKSRRGDELAGRSRAPDTGARTGSTSDASDGWPARSASLHNISAAKHPKAPICMSRRCVQLTCRAGLAATLSPSACPFPWLFPCSTVLQRVFFPIFRVDVQSSPGAERWIPGTYGTHCDSGPSSSKPSRIPEGGRATARAETRGRDSVCGCCSAACGTLRWRQMHALIDAGTQERRWSRRQERTASSLDPGGVVFRRGLPWAAAPLPEQQS